jgi:hypothetical protein
MLLLALVVGGICSTHVDVQKILVGSWAGNLSFFRANSTTRINESVTIVVEATSEDKILDIVIEQHRVLTFTFVDKGTFTINEPGSEVVLAEVEFSSPLMPHLTAVGRWNETGLFSVEFISETALHISLFDQASGTSSFLMLGKAGSDREKSFIEKNFVLFVTGGWILFRLLKGERNRFQRQRTVVEKEKELEKKEEGATEPMSEEKGENCDHRF